MFKKLKSLFIIEEGAPKGQENETAEEKTAGIRKETPKINRPVVTTGPNTSGGQVQDKFLDVLFGALQSNNQEGFDYLEFKDFLRSLANVPMDDATRFKSAFATAQTMGATKDKILSSARQYISLLSNEEVKFQEALTGQKDRNLTGKQDDIKKLEQTIKDKEIQIEKLKKEMDEHRTHITTLEQEINTASEKLSQTANDFEATYRALLKQIEDDVKNIESHL